MTFLDNFFLFFSNYHHKRILNYLQKLNLRELIDVGAHKGEFLSYVIKINSIKKFYAFEPQASIFSKQFVNFMFLKNTFIDEVFTEYLST